MFPLTRPLRQTVSTIVLLLLTVIPTAFVTAIAYRINRPGHIRDVEVELSRKLGMQASVDEVGYPQPGEVVYRGLVLRQEEPRGKGLAEIARADVVRLTRADRELTLLLENAKFHAESPGLAMALLDSIIPRSNSLPFERVALSAPTCRLDLGREDLQFAFKDVAGEFVSDPLAPTLKLVYHVPGAEKGSACELILTRDRRTEPFETSLSFKTTEGSPLPARMLNVFFDAEDWLGADAQVMGTLSLHQARSTDWKADFHGELSDVDLARLVGRRFPRHRLTGRARVAFEQASWGQRPDGQGPGWVQIKGELVSGQGAIGVELFDALAREMKFRPSPRQAHMDGRKPEVDFRSLGVSFAMQSSGEIQINGALGAEFPPDAVISGATTALLSAPQGTANVHGLIKALFPVSVNNPGVMIPLTAESQVLLSLPLPAGARLPVRRTLDGN
jgi:hypothetical protein